jgi:NDP-sugar pyrophosphorylase family protein
VTGDTINAGIYVLEPSVLNRIPAAGSQSFEREVFPAMLHEGASVHAFMTRAYWQDIGSPEKYLDAHFGIMSGRMKLPAYPQRACPPNSWDREQVSIDQVSILDGGCVIKPGVVIENSVLGEDCRVEEGALIRDSVIWSGTRIRPHAHITRSILGRQCHIGEGARLRSGTVLGDKSIVTDYSVV